MNPSPFDDLRQDVCYALRNLVRAPGFTLVVVLSLTFGITAATVAFSFVKAMLFRAPEWLRDPERVAVIYLSDRQGERFADTSRISYPGFRDLRDQVEALSGLAAWCGLSVTVDAPSGTQRRAPAAQVTGGYFDVLGIAMTLGRGITDADLEPGSSPVAVLGHGFWQRQHGGDPDVIGRAVRIDGQPFTVVGVAPPGVSSLGSITATDVWIPLRPEWRVGRVEPLILVGRLGAGAGFTELRAELDVVAERLRAEDPVAWTDARGARRALTVLGEREARTAGGQTTQALAMVTAVITLVLLIACSNVTSLLLTRALRRRREIAVRLALGAGRLRLVRQLLTESVLLTTAAAALGLALTHAVTRLFALGLVTLPFEHRALALDVGVDPGVAVFAGVLALTAGIGFGLVPALEGSRPAVMPALKGAATVHRRRRLSPQNVLVAAKVAGSLVLVVLAALLVRSLRQAQELDLGFEPRQVAVATYDLAHGRYSPPAAERFHAAFSERLRALPGVEAVALGANLPFVHTSNCGLREVEGPGAVEESVPCDQVASGYFKLLRIPVVRGRTFSAADVEGAPPVAVVNEAFAERFWPGEDPLGRRVDGAEVIGVVGNTRFRMFTVEHLPHLWRPAAQTDTRFATVHVRTSGDPRALLPAIRDELAALDPDLTLLDLGLMVEKTATFTEPQRVASTVLGAAGLVALVLAMMGIYGVVAYVASLRTHEVGVRLALGARPRSIVGMMVREGLALAAGGLVAGLVIVAAGTRFLHAVLVGVDPLDPASLAAGVALLVAAAVAASWGPAARAARVDPVTVLRDQ